MTRKKPEQCSAWASGNAATAAVKASIVHPDWCDPGLCTATPATANGEAHRSAPVTVALTGGTIDVRAHLYQAHTSWPTAVLVKLELSGLTGPNWQLVTGTTTITLGEVACLAEMLTGLAATGRAGNARGESRSIEPPGRQAGDAR
jgi:hypothetical protein